MVGGDESGSFLLEVGYNDLGFVDERVDLDEDVEVKLETGRGKEVRSGGSDERTSRKGKKTNAVSLASVPRNSLGHGVEFLSQDEKLTVCNLEESSS